MTPKEKAKKLVQIYFNKVSDANPLEDILFSAKQCAVICVDEIIQNIPSEVMSYKPFIMNTDYWEKVKQEINKL